MPRRSSSFEDAQARLRQMGVHLSIRRIVNVAYHFAERARRRQEVEGMGIEGSLSGKRVVISTDGGRLRVRQNKRGRKTKKGRARYHTDWRERISNLHPFRLAHESRVNEDANHALRPNRLRT